MRPPDRVGPYQVLELLGSGGMGIVYKARDPYGRLVAVKVVRPEYANLPEFRARFQREAEAARRVPRYYTAQVLDVRLHGDRLYMVTEFVDGPTLDHSVRTGGPWSVADLEQLGLSVAGALTAIHGAGVVHRDLKPGNVLLSRSGPRVIDFGIARSLDVTAGMTLTRTGQTPGTPAFMAPEQYLGRAVTPAVDVFAWGGVLVFAATGRNAFGTDYPGVLAYRVVHHEPDLTALDGRLREVVAAALRKEPDERPAPEELVQWLDRGAAHARTEGSVGGGPGDRQQAVETMPAPVVPTPAPVVPTPVPPPAPPLAWLRLPRMRPPAGRRWARLLGALVLGTTVLVSVGGDVRRRAEATPIRLGEEVSGQLDQDVPSRAYTFETTPGLTVALEPGECAPGDDRFQPRWQLYRPSGELHGSGQVCATGADEDAGGPLPEDGTYHLVVYDPADVHGTYRFSLWLTRRFGTTIGDTVEGQLVAPGVRHVHQFNGQDDQLVIVSVEECRADSALPVQMVDPSGELMDDDFLTCDGESSDEWWQYLDSGRHQLVVGGEGAATYRLSLVEAVGESFSIAYGQSVAPGVPAAGAGRLDQPGEDNFWFDGTEGETVTLTIDDCQFEPADHPTGFTFRIGGGVGVIAEASCADGRRETSAIVPESGRYWVEVRGAVTLGTYGFTLAGDTAVGETIGVGDTVEGQFVAPDDRHVYQFHGQDDQFVFISPEACEPESDLRVTLIDPHGAPSIDAAPLCVAGTAEGWWRYLESGRHQLVVIGEGAGTYRVSLVEASEESFRVGYGQTVAPGTPEPGAGRLGEPGKDKFWFAGAEGETVTLTVGDCRYEPAGHAFGFRFELWGPSRRLAEASCADGQRRTSAILPATGDFSVDVLGGEVLGTYGFTLATE